MAIYMLSIAVNEYMFFHNANPFLSAISAIWFRCEEVPIFSTFPLHFSCEEIRVYWDNP